MNIKKANLLEALTLKEIPVLKFNIFSHFLSIIFSYIILFMFCFLFLSGGNVGLRGNVEIEQLMVLNPFANKTDQTHHPQQTEAVFCRVIEVLWRVHWTVVHLEY